MILSILSGIILSLPFSNASLWPLAWIGLLPLFISLDKNPRRPFLLPYLSGVAFWAFTVYWLVHVTLLGTVVLILYLALYFGIFGYLINKIKANGAARLFFIPALWVLLEYARGFVFTGFPWALLGYSQCKNLAVIQIADITGAYGVSFLVVMINVALWGFLRARTNDRPIRNAVVAALILVVTLGYGFYKIHNLNLNPYPSTLKVSVIQGNIPQDMKWVSGTKRFILDRYLNLTQSALGDKPDLIVWPEAASPGLLGEDPGIFDEISALNKKAGIPLLLGAVSRENGMYFNSALLYEGGRITQRYDKLHLVPFGEYIPLKDLFPFLQTIVPIGQISRGSAYEVFSPGGKPFSVLICFEDVFPGISREFVKRGALFLVNITNDAWYKLSSAAYQHLQASIFRALENRVFLVRSANTGISAFIDPSGEAISLVRDAAGKDIFIEGFKAKAVRLKRGGLAFYTRFGDVFIFVCFLFVLCVIISRRK